MNYYKKIGSRNEEEQALLQAIEQTIEEKGIPRKEIPECNSIDDLIEVKHLIDAYVPDVVEIQEPLEEELVDDNSAVDQIEEVELAPIEPPEDTDEDFEPHEEIIDHVDQDDQSDQPSFDPGFISEGYDPFADPIVERSYNNEPEVEALSDHAEVDLDEAEDILEENPTERTKRKAARQTANAILKGYAKLIPKPFKWMAKVSESKVEKLSFAGVIDLNLEVSDGVTFDQYVKETNEQVDEIFEVDEDTLEEIREPLEEVLMEQDMELTPKQRLGMAVISHLMQMLTLALKLRSQNNRILAYQKELTKRSYNQGAA